MACDNLLHFFVQKVEDIRVQILPGSYDPSTAHFTSVAFNQFTPISLQSLAEIIGQLKPTNCCIDIIPSTMIKQTFGITGLSLLM